MIPVYEKNLEIGTISPWERGEITLFQAIVPQENGVISSNTFTSQEDAEEYIREKYARFGYVPFCKRLETAIRISKLSYRTIGFELGCSPAAVFKWTKGEQYPAVHFLWRLTEVLFTKRIAEDKFLEWTQTINKER